jgi:RNA-directed DNA polymerase
MGLVRRRITDKRALALIKAFLKAGILSRETGLRESHAGAPQGGGLCSAEHKPPYEQCWIMRSGGLPVLARAGAAVERCA